MAASIIDGLSEEQIEPVTHIKGPMVVAAGPGSGKTRVLTHRIAYMIDQGIEPSNIAAITFTNKACGEMKERLSKMLGQNIANEIKVATYHSFFASEILLPNREHDELKKLGYQKKVNLLDDSDESKVLRETLKNLPAVLKQLATKTGYKSKQAKKFMGSQRAYGILAQQYFVNNKASIKKASELLKNHQLDIENGSEEEVAQLIQEKPELRKLLDLFVWRAYEKNLIKNNSIDYDGLLVLSQYLLDKQPSIAKEITKQFTHFNFDEFQDTNHVQFNTIKNLAKAMPEGSVNIGVVGDVKQGIYLFREADSTIMSMFAEHAASNVSVFSLSDNYRSSPEIVNTFNHIAKYIKGQLDSGVMNAKKPSGNDSPKIASFSSEPEEARFVMNQIKSMIASGVRPSDISVVYRNKTTKKKLENELVANNIAFHVVNDVDFFKRKEIKILGSLLRAAVRDDDYLGVSNLVDRLDLAISGSTLVQSIRDEQGLPATEGMSQYIQGKVFLKGKNKYTKKGEDRERFLHLFEEVREVLSKYRTFAIDEQFAIGKMIENGINAPKDSSGESRQLLKDVCSGIMADEGLSREFQEFRSASINEIKDTLIKFTELLIEPALHVQVSKDKENSDKEVIQKTNNKVDAIKEVIDLFIKQIEEGASTTDAVDQFVLQSERQEDNDESIKLLTIHASKGLEFKNVILLGVEREAFVRENMSPREINSELCALFVAMSRAEDRLLMTECHNRYINGNEVEGSRSRVINELITAGAIEQIDNRTFDSEQNKNLLPTLRFL